MTSDLHIRPVTLRQASAFVKQHHRHHGTSRGWKFGVGAYLGDQLVGVAMAGRPVSRMLDNGLTLEVTRLCTDGTPNASSLLYGAVRRAAKAMGYKRLITYTLAEETGVSLKASGWKVTGTTEAQAWSRASRPRQDDHPTCAKTRWEAEL